MQSRRDEVHAPRGEALAGVDLERLLREALARVEDVLEEQARLRLLLDAVVGITSELTLDGVLSRVVVAASELVVARYAALGVLADQPDRRLRSFVQHGVDPETARRIGDPPVGLGLMGRLTEDDARPIRIDDVAAHPAFHGFPEHHPTMTSFLGVPVRVRDRVLGTLCLTEKARDGPFTDLDESIAVALAAAAGVAIENARLYEEARRRRDWLSATAEITTLLGDDTAADAALQVVADRARSVSGADVAWVVTGSSPRDLRLEVVAGVPVDIDAMRNLPMENSLASIVVRSGQPLSVQDLAGDPRAVDPSSIEGWPRLGPVMVVPLRSGKGAEGVLSLAWTPEHAEGFDRVDPELPTSFAEQATLALQVARAREDRRRVTVLEDRDRIARDLHDLIIQRLFAVGLGLQSAANLVHDDDRATQRLQEAIDDIDDTIKDIRRTIFALGPMDTTVNLQTEIEGLVDRARAVMKLRPRLRLEGPIRTGVPSAVAPDLVAVLSEALTNVGRHADASAVDVNVSVGEGSVTLVVSDDGRGLEERGFGSGLQNMRARAVGHGGDMVVESRAGDGTTLTWRVPLVPGPMAGR